MDMISIRRSVVLASNALNPPSAEYKYVEYIESSGTQYLKTGYTPVQDDEIDIGVYYNSALGCAFSAGTGTYQLLFLQDAYRYWKYFASGSAKYWPSEIPIGSWQTIHVAKTGILTLNNIDSEQSTYMNAIDGNDPFLRVFCRANGTSFAKCRISHFTITNNGVTKLNLMPCYRVSDSEIGMLDTVSKAFYTNAGTGTFTKGQDL